MQKHISKFLSYRIEILFYSDNSVTVDMAMREAEDYFRRKGMSSVFVHKTTLSGMGKKLAYKCMGKKVCLKGLKELKGLRKEST